MDEIATELYELFKDAKIDDEGIRNYPGDTSGKSKTKTIYFDFSTGDAGRVGCVDFSKKLNKTGDKDHLRVSLVTQEYWKWFTTQVQK